MSHLKRPQVSSRWLAVACALAVVGSSVAAVDCPELIRARERAAQVDKDLADEVKRWNGIEQQRSTLEREIKAAESKQSQLRDEREAKDKRQRDEINAKGRAAEAKLKQAQEHITEHTTNCDVMQLRKAGKPVPPQSMKEHEKALNDAYAARDQAQREISAAQRELAGLVPGGVTTDAEYAAGREIVTKKSQLGGLEGSAINAKSRVEQLDLDKKNAQIALKSEDEKCRKKQASEKSDAVKELDRKIQEREAEDERLRQKAIREYDEDERRRLERIKRDETPAPRPSSEVVPPPAGRPSTPPAGQSTRPPTTAPSLPSNPAVVSNPATPTPNPPKKLPAVDWANEFGSDASKLVKQEAVRQVTNRGSGVTWTTDPDLGYEAGPGGITKPGENVENGILRNAAGGATVEVAEQQLSKAALDEAAQRRFGKRYDELLPSQKVELDSERAGPDALAALLRDAGKSGTHMKDWVKKYMDKFVAPDIVNELSSPSSGGK